MCSNRISDDLAVEQGRFPFSLWICVSRRRDCLRRPPANPSLRSEGTHWLLDPGEWSGEVCDNFLYEDQAMTCIRSDAYSVWTSSSWPTWIYSQTSSYNGPMTSVPLGEAKNRLSEYVTDVERTHDRVLITRHGHPAAVLISPEDLAALEETVDILTTTGAREAIAEGLDDLAAGRIADNDALRARFASR